MYTAVAARHLYSAPGTALIVGDLKRRRVSGQTGCAVAAQPVCEYPASTCKHLDGLAAEASLPGKQHIRFAPGAAAVRTFLPADDRRELHIILAGHTVQLGCINRPYSAVRREKQRGILLTAFFIMGHLYWSFPSCGSFGQAGANDAHIAAAFKAAGKPGAQQTAVRSFQQGGRMRRSPGPGGQHGLHRSHCRILINGAVRCQAGQTWIFHGFLPLTL